MKINISISISSIIMVLITMILAILKELEIIDISWTIVLCPIWGSFLLAFAVFVILLIDIFIAKAIYDLFFNKY